MSGAGGRDGEPDVDWDGHGDTHVLAGEFVLGALEPDEAAEVRRSAMSDLDLADAIVRWEVRLAPLADLAGLVSPPPALWARVEASVFGTASSSGVASETRGPSAQVIPLGPAPDRRVRLWQGATVIALAMAAALAVVAFLPRQSGPVEIAALVPTSAPAAGFFARVSSDNMVVVSALSPASVPSNRDLELWLLPPGAAKPISLGVLPASGRTVALPGPQPPGTQLLVSLEPRGGSTTGLPTGPVLYGGALSRS